MSGDWWDDATAEDWRLLDDANLDRERMGLPVWTLPELWAERDRVLTAIEVEWGLG